MAFSIRDNLARSVQRIRNSTNLDEKLIGGLNTARANMRAVGQNFVGAGQNLNNAYRQWQARPSNQLFSNPRQGLQNIGNVANRVMGGSIAEFGQIASQGTNNRLAKNVIDAGTRIPGAITRGVSFNTLNPLKNTQATTLGGKAGEFVGSMYGYGQSPVTKTILNVTNPIANKMVGRLSPNLSRIIGSSAPRVSGSIANITQGLAFDAANQSPTTPLSVGIDALSGFIAGPNQFARPTAKGFTLNRSAYDDLVQAEDMIKNPSKFMGTEFSAGSRTEKEALKKIQAKGLELVDKLSAQYLPNKELSTIKTVQGQIKALTDLHYRNGLANVPVMGIVDKKAPQSTVSGITTKASENPDSVGAVISNVAYPYDSIDEQLSAFANGSGKPGFNLENFKKLYNPSEKDLSIAKAMNVEVPTQQEAWKIVQQKAQSKLPSSNPTLKIKPQSTLQDIKPQDYKTAEEFITNYENKIKSDYSNRFNEAQNRLPDVPKIIKSGLTEKSAEVYQKIHKNVEIVDAGGGRFNIVEGTRKKTFLGMTPQEREVFYKENPDLFQNKTLLYESGQNGGIYSNTPSVNKQQLTDLWNQSHSNVTQAPRSNTPKIKISGTGKIDPLDQQKYEADLIDSETKSLLRSIYSDNEISLFNRVKSMARAKDVAAGDVETLYKKNPELVERAFQAVKEKEPNITTNDEAFDYIQNIPTKAETLPPKLPTEKVSGIQAYNAEAGQKIKIKQLKTEAKLREQQAKADYADWQRQVFQQERATQTTSKAVGQATKAVKSGTSSPISNPDALKDISGIKAYGRDVYRNFKEVYGKNFDKVKELVLDPFDRSKGKMVQDLKTWTDQLNTNVVKKFGITKGSKESAAIQQFGEGKIDQVTLIKQFGEKKANQIIESDKWFRQAYDSLLEQVNTVRARIYPNNPDKIVLRRKDYYRHFTELAEGVKGLLNIFDNPANISSALSGTSEYLKPKSKWLSFAQKRLGIKTQEDAVGGFLDYLKAQTYAANIDPHIERFRSLSDELAKNTAEGANAGKLNGFIEYLQDFSNDLSGKTNPADRFAQKVIGRKPMRVINWLNNRVKANVILGNVSSSIAQIFNVPQGIADAGPINATKGLGRTIANIFDGGSEIKQSSFINERYSGDLISQFDSRLIEQPKKLAAWITGVLDRVGTKYIWNMEYERAISQGIKNPLKFADDRTRAMVAGRGIGEVPLIQKAKTFQLVAPFTLEVGNLWHVMKDWTDEKQFGKLAAFFVVSHVFNKGAESIRGSDVNFDPIQASIDAYNAYQEEEDKKIGALRAGGRLTGEVLSNIPLGQTAASIYPEYGFKVGETQLPTRKDLFGEGDPTRFGSGLPGVLAGGIQDPMYKIIPPFGGQQLKRTIEGVQTSQKGYSESNTGKVQFPVEQTPLRDLQRAVFGKYSTPEARNYFDNKRTPLGEKQTDLFKQATNKMTTYDEIITKREDDSIVNKAKEKLRSSGGSSTKVGNKYLILQDNGDIGTVDVSKITSMPERSNLERSLKQKETWSAVNKLLGSEMEGTQKLEALNSLGVKPEDASYHYLASQESDIKMAYLSDALANVSSRDDLIKRLLSLRIEVNGKRVLNDTMIDELYNSDIIGPNEKRILKSYKWDEGSKSLVSKSKGGGGGSVTKSELLASYKRLLDALSGSSQNKQRPSQSLAEFYASQRAKLSR